VQARLFAMSLAELKKKANEAISKNDMELSLSLLNQAIELAPDDRALWANRSYVHEMRKAPEEALRDARRTIEIDPGFPKGFLRASRALIALGRAEEAYELLAGVIEEFPQDYALAEALTAADNARATSGRLRHGNSAAVAESEASLVEAAVTAAELRDRRRINEGLGSSYYYAAVPSTRHTLPVEAPSRINAGADIHQRPNQVELAAAGGIRADLEKKGGDSYYYAHARMKDYHVPTVPKRIDAGGGLTPWQP